MDRRKKYYLVVDVETANSTQEALVYDLGFAICDKKGNIYEFKDNEFINYYTYEEAKAVVNLRDNTEFHTIIPLIIRIFYIGTQAV